VSADEAELTLIVGYEELWEELLGLVCCHQTGLLLSLEFDDKVARPILAPCCDYLLQIFLLHLADLFSGSKGQGDQFRSEAFELLNFSRASKVVDRFPAIPVLAIVLPLCGRHFL
jgi:hypothetical protein